MSVGLAKKANGEGRSPSSETGGCDRPGTVSLIPASSTALTYGLCSGRSEKKIANNSTSARLTRPTATNISRQSPVSSNRPTEIGAVIIAPIGVLASVSEDNRVPPNTAPNM
jgi:hypothetical protein